MFSQGDDGMRAIEKVIDTTEVAVVFISVNSASDPHIEQAISMIVHKRLSTHRQLEVLPVILDDTTIPPLLKDVHLFDLRHGNVSTGISYLAAAIRGHGSLRRSQNPPGKFSEPDAPKFLEVRRGTVSAFQLATSYLTHLSPPGYA